MLKEFKEFALKGNMLDLAVAVIIGGAFGKIIDSLVKDIIMPPIAMLTGGKDFSSQFAVLKDGSPAGPYASLDAATKAGANTLNYGVFINAIVTFLIIAFSIFLVVKGVNKMRREPEPEPEVAPTPSAEEVLLTEIRDLLKNR